MKIICILMLLLCFTSCADSDVETKNEYPTELPTESHTVFTFDTSYVYKGSADPIMPKINLDITNNKYSFVYSGLSSYMPIGDYEITDGKLYLWEDAEKTKAYVFTVTDKGYVFEAENSVALPTYRLSGYSDERYTPVPDGALFESAAEDWETPVVLTDGWVKRRGNTIVNKLSDEDLAAISDIIEGKEWKDDLCDGIVDCHLKIGGLFVNYCSSCGTMIKLTPSYTSHAEPDGIALTLGDEDKARFNSILEKYITLGSDVIP